MAKTMQRTPVKLELLKAAGISRSWQRRISDAKRRGHFTNADKRLASCNTSCSLGEAAILRTEKSFHKSGISFSYVRDPDNDNESADMTFYYAVKSDNIARAAYIHAHIKKTIAAIQQI